MAALLHTLLFLGTGAALVAGVVSPGRRHTGPASKHFWVFQTSDEHKYVHMSTVEPLPDGRIAVAFQTASGEGNDDQAIFFKRSSDGGASWEPHRIAVKDGFPQAVWGPVLQFNPHAAELLLFFSASVPANARGPGRSYPGGDIYLQRSADAGDSWTAPVRLLEYHSAARGNISKVTANKAAVSADFQTWVLPFWQERHVAADTGPSCAGVLVSTDYGSSFRTTSACLRNDTAGWLIENTIAPVGAGAAAGQLVQLFRTTAGHVWRSTSADWGESWSDPAPTSLLNPNSKVFVAAVPGSTTGELVATYNPSDTARTPLDLATTTDGGATWTNYAVLDTDRSVAYPTTAFYKGNGTSSTYEVLTTYSASTTDGIRIAVTPLPPALEK